MHRSSVVCDQLDAVRCRVDMTEVPVPHVSERFQHLDHCGFRVHVAWCDVNVLPPVLSELGCVRVHNVTGVLNLRVARLLLHQANGNGNGPPFSDGSSPGEPKDLP